MAKFIRHQYHDNIMAARFSVFVEAPETESQRIGAVSEEFFEEVRDLESLLSRYIEDSEVSQINRLQKGESVIVSPPVFRCFQLALEAERLSGGRFNCAYASENLGSPHAFSLLPRPIRVRSESEKLQIDFGGIGKGIALDFGRHIFLQHDYDRALLCADSSTVLALTPPRDSDGWEILIDSTTGTRTLAIAREALSCSGTSVRGEHIFDTAHKCFISKTHRVWIKTESAALADALSTALVTMDAVQRSSFQSRHRFDIFE